MRESHNTRSRYAPVQNPFSVGQYPVILPINSFPRYLIARSFYTNYLFIFFSPLITEEASSESANTLILNAQDYRLSN